MQPPSIRARSLLDFDAAVAVSVIVAKPKANGAQPAQAAAAAAVHHPYEERYARMFVVAPHNGSR